VHVIETIVFDLGNVVVYFDHRLAADRLAGYGNLSSEDLLAWLFGGPLEDAYESGRLSTEEFIRQVRDRAGLRCSDDEFATAYADIFWPNPEVEALLPVLKARYRLLVGSNTSELHARQFRRQFAAPLGLFDGQVLSFEIGVRKPHPGFFEYCQRRAQCAPEACLFIDDLPANVAGARASGWHGIVYQGTNDLVQHLGSLGIHVDVPRLT
jgi:putative hydrolase of the HAD superfamily